MCTQITFDNFSVHAKDYENDFPKALKINSPAENFLPAAKLIERQREIEKRRAEEQVLVQICEYLNYERAKLLSETLNEAVKELCVARLCQALGLSCAYNFKNEFFNFFSCIMGEVVANKLGHNLGIDEYNLKYVKVENINLIYCAHQMLENPNIDQAFIDVYNLALRFKHLIFELKRN